jgi:death on curing protein
MSDYLMVAEVYLMQHRLIELFGGAHGIRDKAAIEAAVFRPQIGYYNSLQEEAAALMESLANNHGFIDGSKRTAVTAADVFLRRNGFYIDVERSRDSISSTARSTATSSASAPSWSGSGST